MLQMSPEAGFQGTQTVYVEGSGCGCGCGCVGGRRSIAHQHDGSWLNHYETLLQNICTPRCSRQHSVGSNPSPTQSHHHHHNCTVANHSPGALTASLHCLALQCIYCMHVIPTNVVLKTHQRAGSALQTSFVVVSIKRLSHIIGLNNTD